MFLRMGAGGWGVYLFFCLMQLASIPYICFLLPETRNIPLEEMDRLFAQKNVWNANRIVMAELKREHELGAAHGAAYLKPQKGSDEMLENVSSQAASDKV
ncbi:hypothetical protein JCM3770_002424 [Rhodotorula araucariae]